MSNILIIVDVQNDFVDGSLGSAMAKTIIEPVVRLIKKSVTDGDHVVFTRDTHGQDYFNTQEGRNLPVEHCVSGTKGHEIYADIAEVAPSNAVIVDKPTFGSFSLVEIVSAFVKADTTIRIVGLCTDICVITNALIIKTAFPENRVVVYRDCCAGVTQESHEAALLAMRSCQIDVECFE